MLGFLDFVMILELSFLNAVSYKEYMHICKREKVAVLGDVISDVTAKAKDEKGAKETLASQ